MSILVWDKTGERYYESGVDHGVLYPRNSSGAYPKGVVWNGLTNISENPEGGEPTDLYADNIKYLSLMSAEKFNFTIECYTYPDEWEACDGSAEIGDGVTIGQQNRQAFGLSYRTKVGNDVAGQDLGYKIHLVYGCLASPSEKAFETINDDPSAIQFSYSVNTTPVDVPGFKPSATLVIDSRKVDHDVLEVLEGILYGTETEDAYLPMPEDILDLLDGDTPAPPEYTYQAVTPVGNENPASEGWYERTGTNEYTPTSDTSVDETKTYYERTLAA